VSFTKLTKLTHELAGVVKLSDFGSSKKLGSGKDELDQQMLAGTFTGTSKPN
jgi:hypothetical protein